MQNQLQELILMLAQCHQQDMCAFEEADVEDCMKKCAEEQKHFDVIMLDPPKLAPTLSSNFHTKN